MSKKEIPFFTVIITTYNRIDYLREAVDSVISQTFKNWILHIVDNSSSDGTKQFLEALIKKNKKIKFSTIQNNGVIAISRNYGIKNANTKAISFLDDDDIWYPNKLENDYQILSKMDGIVYSKCHAFYGNNNKRRTLPNRKISLKNPTYDLLHYGNIFTTSTISYSLNKLSKNQRFNESHYFRTWEDYEFWIRLINDSQLKPYCTFKFGAKYRISNIQNSSPIQDIKNIKSITDHFKKQYDQFKLIRIENAPLWCHYNKMNSLMYLGNFGKGLISLFYTCIISLRKYDLLFLCKSLIKYIYLFIKCRLVK